MAVVHRGAAEWLQLDHCIKAPSARPLTEAEEVPVAYIPCKVANSAHKSSAFHGIYAELVKQKCVPLLGHS